MTTVAMRVPRTLGDLAGGGSYPSDLLEDCASALMLFCAGFYGQNDCYYVARADVGEAVCVDTDELRLAAMRHIYPPSWAFVADDVYDWVAEWVGPGFDLVAADPPTSESDRTFALLPVLAALASRLLIVGVMDETLEREDVSEGDKLALGWTVTRIMRRNGQGAHWMVLQP